MTIATVAFDAYGTLLDVHAAIAREGAVLGAKAEAVSRLWRVKQLEYSWVGTLSGRYADFERATEDGLDFALTAHGVADAALKAALLAAYDRLDAYADVRPALERLKARGVKTAIFTNGTPRMIAAAAAAAGLSALVDRVVTVAPVRRFKTAPETYAHLLAETGGTRENLLFVSSNRWDVAGAKAFGLRPVWCNRTGQPDEYRDLPPIATIAGLGALEGVLAELG